MDETRTMPKIAIVGAGVVGLTTATLIQNVFPKAQVTLIADKFLTETTSDGAAGLFRPGWFSGPTHETTKKWIKDSYDFYTQILESSPDAAQEAGIRKLSGYYFSSKSPAIVENAFLKEVLPDYRSCTAAELRMFGHNYKYGTYCTTVLTECRKYLPYLMKKFQQRGGLVVRRKLQSLEELSGDYFDLTFNCSGLGAKDLVGDRAVTSIRGQVYKVKAPWLKHFVYTDYDVYIIPGEHFVTLGGVRQFDSFKEKIDPHDSKAIWDRCVEVIPALKDAKVEREWVGLRPYRPCVRVERETMKISGGRTMEVIHNYGHGGYGVMTAPGTSMAAVDLGVQYIQNGNRKEFKAKL